MESRQLSPEALSQALQGSLIQSACGEGRCTWKDLVQIASGGVAAVQLALNDVLMPRRQHVWLEELPQLCKACDAGVHVREV